jgi:hypothetical protein
VARCNSSFFVFILAFVALGGLLAVSTGYTITIISVRERFRKTYTQRFKKARLADIQGLSKPHVRLRLGANAIEKTQFGTLRGTAFFFFRRFMCGLFASIFLPLVLWRFLISFLPLIFDVAFDRNDALILLPILGLGLPFIPRRTIQTALKISSRTANFITRTYIWVLLFSFILGVSLLLGHKAGERARIQPGQSDKLVSLDTPYENPEEVILLAALQNGRLILVNTLTLQFRSHNESKAANFKLQYAFGTDKPRTPLQESICGITKKLPGCERTTGIASVKMLNPASMGD